MAGSQDSAENSGGIGEKVFWFKSPAGGGVLRRLQQNAEQEHGGGGLPGVTAVAEGDAGHECERQVDQEMQQLIVDLEAFDSHHRGRGDGQQRAPHHTKDGDSPEGK